MSSLDDVAILFLLNEFNDPVCTLENSFEDCVTDLQVNDGMLI